MRVLAAAIAAFALTAYGQITPAQRQLNIESFEKIWTTIRDKHWEKNPGGLDWQAVHEEFRPRVEQAQSMEQARTTMREMLGRLHETHFAIFPGSVYEAAQGEAQGPGSPGIDVRVLNGQAVVTSVDPGSPAEHSGVRPGWGIQQVNGASLDPVIKRLSADSSIPEITLTRAVLARLSGPIGGSIRVTFLEGRDQPLTLQMDLAPPRGSPANFGNLPQQQVWFESKKIERTGYIRFNMFLDVVRVMDRFGKAIADCQDCEGLIIDVRGNPGGIGAMAMGMAGYLVTKPGLRLGTMYTRDTPLNFVINPRPPGFSGPVAVLVDAESASTAEIFAGGLKDLGRARVFGTRSAAAALPSTIEKLPNGDGFQYAVANYISEGGKPLEGVGVQPDVEVKLTRAALLSGHDAVLDAALKWVKSEAAPKGAVQ